MQPCPHFCPCYRFTRGPSSTPVRIQMGRAARSMRPCQEATRVLARLFEDGVADEPAGGRFGKGNYDRMKASRSALITSAFVVHMPCGKPGYTLSVPFLSSLA